MQREEIINRYFQSWISKDAAVIEQTFAENIVYNECYGPEYHGLRQVRQWFCEWNKYSSAIEWRIKSYVHQGMITAVEWYFECNYGGEDGHFDGVSLIEFDESMKIVSVKEFQSKAEHYCPYQ